MDIVSMLIFLIYSVIILGILVFVSPLLSAIIMILVPLIFIYIFPGNAIEFLSRVQFSYYGIQVFNIHIMLIIWSTFAGIIAYAEVLTWYLLREKAPAKVKINEPAVQDKKPKSLLFNLKDALQKIFKVLKGEKIRSKP